MLGWINDCVEKLVLEKFGVSVWHAVKEKAGCQVKDGGFLKLEHYPDGSTIALVNAASELSGLTVPQVYEAFGSFFVPYIINEGYENLLCCQGSTLRDWMTNINAIHQHLQTTFPKKMTMPEFWCEENHDGTLTLFYYSARGNFLSPLAVGLVTEVAKRQFDLSIVMTQQTSQGVDGARFTSWIVSTEDPVDLPKLRTKQGSRNGVPNAPTAFKCPMSGMELSMFDVPHMVKVTTHDEDHLFSKSCSRRASKARSVLTSSTSSSTYTEDDDSDSDAHQPGGLSPAATRRLFPYHVVMNSEFCITQIGKDLPKVLGATEANLCGQEIDEVFDFVNPKPAKWTRSWLRKLEDQEFVLACSLTTAPANVFFKGTVASVGRNEVMLILCPDAKNLEELREMKLTLSDLPAHGAYRDAVFLREHLSRQMNNALKMEKLSKKLTAEKELLESLIPHHAAEGLRKGQTVEPMLHNNVTMFFSDVVGFTNICKHISPWEVIGMLNKLYGVMDFLAGRFGLFKVETIGDAYVCCSGLPESDENHALNVANFALAVQHCCQSVRSPLDGSPIKLRIGIHSGSCASGIVGVTNPRYCVFGDTVNTTARHESTGEPGRVHCSLTAMLELQRRANEHFNLISRGMVEMKGKGSLPTYWLEATNKNPLVNPDALIALDEEVAKLAYMSQAEKLASIPQKRSNTNLKSLDEHVEEQAELRRPSKGSDSSRGAGLNDDTESCQKSLSSNCSSTPSRRELAKLLSSSGSRTKRLSRRSEQRRGSALDMAKDGISLVLEVVESAEAIAATSS